MTGCASSVSSTITRLDVEVVVLWTESPKGHHLPFLIIPNKVPIAQEKYGQRGRRGMQVRTVTKPLISADYGRGLNRSLALLIVRCRTKR
ncbi:hypothetical protein ACH5RR_004795 [Cinchona calisaya]|uniref:Uncharacterized protein n=1 Tax=Cinchona calisaya TaxID=153742 RepID=A0ABD3AYN8_9GENT